MTVLAGVVLFQVPFRGSFALLMALAGLFLVGVLAFGLFISAAAKSQLLASQVAVVSTFLPSFLLSGFVYPIYNMPDVLQALTHLVPARYLIAISKGIFLKGVGFDVLVGETLFLLGFTCLFALAAVRKFKKRIAK
jgi:ABC-2 type transport system permease protein